MVDIPDEILGRRDQFCRRRSRFLDEDFLLWGFDGFVWHTTVDSILKVFLRTKEFRQELAVYQRLQVRQVERIHGFHVPLLLDYDQSLEILELSFVRPPYILDFAEATLDRPPRGFDPQDADWVAEHQRVFGARWPDVARLLDALRHLGIHYRDVHRENIRFAQDLVVDDRRT